MKISKYINKYDYMSFHTKPKGLWFFSNTEISSALETEIKKISLNKYEEDEEESEESDGEFDFYEYYKERLDANKDLDNDNPNIIQGKIIDFESRDFIKKSFSNIKNIVDLEEKYGRLSNEKAAEITKQYLENNDSIIIFQSVFIYKDLITKPDAIIKENGILKIIETKGTTSSKFIHYLDLFFQKEVIENQEYLKNEDMLYEYFLCLIKYCYLNKNEISFELTEYINLKKTVATPPNDHKVYIPLKDKEIIEFKNGFKKGYVLLDENQYPLKIKDLMYDKFDDLETNLEIAKGISKKALVNSFENLKKINNNFEENLKEMRKHKSNMDINSLPYFKPSSLDKSPYKNCDFFPMERKLFAYQGFNIFDYSGNIAYQNDVYLDNAIKNDNKENFLKKPKANPNIFIELFNVNKTYLINENLTNKILNTLNSKKVYFDFETINTPIRVVDNTLPFMQIVTQCSIIKFDKENQELDDAICNNLIIDPLKINIEWFKEIVDEIYWDKNNDEITNPINDVSYIVYNKSFEVSRLKEMAKMINQKEYYAKVDSIIKNIFDLADMFKVKSTDPNYLIFFKELGGFYSIKKVLPLIDKYNKDIYTKTKCLNYSDLEISNGQICQTETVKRFFKIIDDEKWKHVEKQMQIYCENDVRAMIAVEFFIYDLIK